MKYKVSAAEDLEAARPAAVRLWRDNLDFVFDPADKHAWYYRDNPQGQGAVLFLRQAEGDAAEEASPVGCLGLGVRRFCVRGVDARAGVYVDMAVDKKHRTLFPALLLQRAARRQAQQSFDFAYGEPNQYAVKVFAKMGYKQVGRMRRFARVLRHGHYLARVVHSPLLASVGGEGLDALGLVRELLRRPRLPRNLRFGWIDSVDSIDDRFDDLWQRTRAHYTVVGYRGADYLRWRFRRSPRLRRCDVGVLSDTRSGRIEAYLAVHDEGPMAALFDLFGPVDRLALLVRAAMPELRALGYEAISIGLLGAPQLVRALRRLGFRERDLGNPVIIDPQQHPAAASLTDEASWFLTDGDQDG